MKLEIESNEVVAVDGVFTTKDGVLFRIHLNEGSIQIIADENILGQLELGIKEARNTLSKIKNLK